MTPSDAVFIEHAPCESCGSSDAKAVYTDGHTHCFKCSKTVSGGTSAPAKRKRKAAGLVDGIAIQSLAKRKLTEATCAKFGYGIAVIRGTKYQVAPYCDGAGNVVAQKLRGPDKDFSVRGDLGAAGLFGQHLWRDSGRKVVVTEGEIDAMSVSQCQDNRYPVVSIPNGAQGAAKAIKKSLDWLEQFDEVVLMFDMDEPGRAAAEECASLLSPGKAKIAHLPLKDASEMLMAGRAKELIDAVWGAKVYRPDGIVSGEEVWDYLTARELSHSAQFPHQGLNAATLGMRTGEVIVYTAGTGTGKSTWARETAYSLIQQGEKVGYIALEESVARSALGLCSIGLNKPLHLDRTLVPEAVLRTQFDVLKDRVVFYDHFGSLEADNLLAKIRYMAKGLGCRFIVLDHLSIVVSGLEAEEGERRMIDMAMTRIASLAQEADCCIIVISHLRKSGDRPHEEGKPVSLSDLRGSHGIAQLGHTIISIERDQQGDSKHLSKVRVLKCRHTGATGLVGHLLYEQDTGRLRETSIEFSSDPLDEEAGY